MFTVDVKKQLDEYSKRVSENLAELLPNANDGQAQVVKAMKYSLMNGGKSFVKCAAAMLKRLWHTPVRLNMFIHIH